MVLLIDKDVLAAKIEKRLNYRIESLKAINDGTYWKEEQSKDEFNKSLTRCAFNAVKNELFELKCILDTLEVKKVSLNEHQIADMIQNLFPTDNFIESETLLLNREEAIKFAKYFLELGLKYIKKG